MGKVWGRQAGWVVCHTVFLSAALSLALLWCLFMTVMRAVAVFRGLHSSAQKYPPFLWDCGLMMVRMMMMMTSLCRLYALGPAWVMLSHTHLHGGSQRCPST